MFVVAGKYHVLAQLGTGGMGAVYEAVHSGTGRRVAVKMLRHEIAANERSRTRFVREARLVGGIESEHVAEVFDAGTDEASGLPYIVMELLDGPDLRRVLQEQRKLPVVTALTVAEQVARGLAAAHDAGVVHRDVKPANIVLCKTRADELCAKIVDFGVAKALEDDVDSGKLTSTGDVVGSLHYMSPEQLKGGPVGPASDVWSLGAVLYEALSGIRPSGESDAIGIIVERVCHRDVPALAAIAPWVPANVSDVVERALARDPLQRYASSALFAEALAVVLRDGSSAPIDVAVAVAAPAPPERPRLVLRRAAAAVLAAGAVLAIGVAFVALRPRSSTAAAVVAPATEVAVGPTSPSPSPTPVPAPEPAPASAPAPAATVPLASDDEPAPSAVAPRSGAARAAFVSRRPRASSPSSSPTPVHASPRSGSAAVDPLDHM